MKKILPILSIASLMLGCEPIEGLNNENTQALKANPWTLKSYGFATDTPSSVMSDTSYSIEFKENLQVSGTIDCNGFSSTYSADASSIHINEVAVTEIGCALMGEAGYQDQHNFIINALSTVSSYTIVSGELTLKSVDSSELLFTHSTVAN